MSYETTFFSVDQGIPLISHIPLLTITVISLFAGNKLTHSPSPAWVEGLQSSTRTDVMSATAYGKIQLLMKTGISAKELYDDAFMAKKNIERNHPMHEWFTTVVLQASLAAENAAIMPPKNKAKALSATAAPFVPRPPPASPSPAEMDTEFEKRCAKFSIRLSKK
ncbi:hypothetical protein PG984_011478 [Apiospora sp. TS-2023a]